MAAHFQQKRRGYLPSNRSLTGLVAFSLAIGIAVTGPNFRQIQLRSLASLRYIDKISSTNAGAHLVTGVAGYIGSHMALALLERGESVVGVDNMSRGSPEALDVLRAFPRFTSEEMDLGDPHALEVLFESYDFGDVIHLASVAFTLESMEDPDLYDRNITGNTRLLVDAMIGHGVPTLLYSSSCSVYGEPDTLPITEETATAPTSPYGKSKLAAEEYIHSRVSSKFRAGILRYFNVVGSDAGGRLRENPLSELSRYARLWTACLEVVSHRRPCVTLYDSTLEDTPDGTAVRDYVHVDDVVHAHMNMLFGSQEEEEGGRPFFEVWNVATGRPVSAMEFVEAARRVTGSFIPICFGDDEKKGSAPPRLYASGERLRLATGWRPAYTDIDSMLATAWKTQKKSANDNSDSSDWIS